MALSDLPNIQEHLLDLPDMAKLAPHGDLSHPPRILLLYGSLRERSFSRFLIHEAARILEHFGAEVKIFDPMDLPMAGSVPEDHPKVLELRALSLWSGTAWGDYRCDEKPDRLDSAGAGRATSEPRAHAGSHAGMWRLAVIQRGQYLAIAGTLDADVYHSESVLRTDGIQGI